MIYLFPLLCLPMLFTEALHVGLIRSYLGTERRLQEGNTTNEVSKFMLKTLNNTTTFTFGFLRTDTFDWLRDTWIQAQVLPIGICFKEGEKGGSAQIDQVTMDDTSVLRISNVYDSSDCSGDFLAVPYLQSRVEVANQLETRISHVQELDQALELNPPSANGLIITSYYSSEGCTGAPAQYDLATDACAVYDHPIGAYGTFRCDVEAEMMVLTMYGPYDADVYTYPICNTNDYQTDFFDEYLIGYGYGDTDNYSYEDNVDVVKQPFQCTDESATGDEYEQFPYYQTVQCVYSDVTWEKMLYSQARGGARGSGGGSGTGADKDVHDTTAIVATTAASVSQSVSESDGAGDGTENVTTDYSTSTTTSSTDTDSVSTSTDDDEDDLVMEMEREFESV